MSMNQHGILFKSLAFPMCFNREEKITAFLASKGLNTIWDPKDDRRSDVNFGQQERFGDVPLKSMLLILAAGGNLHVRSLHCATRPLAFGRKLRGKPEA